MDLTTTRYTEEELFEMTVNVVKYNNELNEGDGDLFFSVSRTRGFYTDQYGDLYLMGIEDNRMNQLIKIDKEQLKAMYVLYENVADALKLEKE